MLNGLSLFSGIGGFEIALRDFVRPIAYCEIDPYCQGVLLSRMADDSIATAPIWDDISTLQSGNIRACVDIIYGGFPCQNISIAGNGKGLGGEQSGLFFEMLRLAQEIKPKFIFLENVPAITSRGGLQVVNEITSLGYDCRWCVISAASVGALHKRDRWFLLAHSQSERLKRPSSKVGVCDTDSQPSKQADKITESLDDQRGTWGEPSRQYWPFESREHWQEVECEFRGIFNGLSHRVDRLRALGNSVVPKQAKEAFEILIGLKN